MHGYTGKILFVDLTRRACEEQAVPDDVYDRYLAGIGLAAHVTYHRMPAGADPLGPDNVLGFVAGILTGTGALFGGRWLVTGKSPLTGGWGDANCGGTFGPAIKQCGYDGIFFTGAASEPVYLYADGEQVEIRGAADLWGLDATETEERLIAAATGPRKARVACIGPAGERRSLIAGVCNDRGRLAARSGLGAVMGAKKLKAIVLAGGQSARVADPTALKRLSQACQAYIPKGEFRVPGWLLPLAAPFMMGGKQANRLDGLTSLPALRKWGTSAGNQVCIITGDTPVKNWQGTAGDYAHKAIGSDRLLKRVTKRYHCYACPLGCGAIASGPEGYAETHRPEYEASASLGPLLLNEDLDSIFLLNELLNRAGMDVISAGATVAFAIECYENGILTAQDTGGLELTWGNTPAIVALVKMMIARNGPSLRSGSNLGDLLADGVRAAAARLGRGAERFAMHAGGQELPMHDPKQDPGYGVHYSGEPTPGRHTIGSAMTYEGLRLWTRVSWAPEAPKSYPVSERYVADATKGTYAAACSLFKMVVDGAGACTFGANIGADRYPLFEYLNAATGWEKTPDEYMEIGRRVQTLRQLFNVREGIAPAGVVLPGRAYGDPPPVRGPQKGRHFDIEAMRRHYWQALGWDADSGRPLPATLEQLGLGDLGVP